MIFHIHTVTAVRVLAATTAFFVADANNDLSIPCYDYSNVFGNLGPTEYSEQKLLDRIKDAYDKQHDDRKTKKKMQGGCIS